ncbi:tigger transposable element-derived protein 6-like [Mytilus edulis]|uniref:tigger transposable element-derived protein 6-like n=1 Tax=Mytilus edulis TaxID=6550 RepID=UPI0039EE9260
MSRPVKRQLVELSLSDKGKLIKDHDSVPKPLQTELAEKYKVGKSTVGDIPRKKDTYLQQFQLNADSSKQRFNTNCKLDRWKSRYFVHAFKVNGESASVDTTTVEEYHTRLPDITKGYTQADIFNCDETGLFNWALPDKTFGVKNQSCKGGKNAKERLTVMFACSSTGGKLKPLVIGKSNNPCCFKNVNKGNLPVTYYSNKKAWMTTNAFIDWLRTVNTTMRLQRRHIHMFLDNTSSH